MEVSLDKEYRTVGGGKIKLFHIFPVPDEYGHRVFGALVEDLDKNIWHPCSWSIEGYYNPTYHTTYHPERNLVEVGKYDHFKIDDKIWVWNDKDPQMRAARHFAGIDANGCPLAFNTGCTSWTSGDRLVQTMRWDHAVLADDFTPEMNNSSKN